MHKLLIVTAAAAAASLPGVAQAQERGFYGSLGVGVAKVSETEVSYYDEGGTFGGTGTADTLALDANLKSAVELKAALGYDFGMVRTDIELAYGRNKLKSFTIESVNDQPVTISPSQGEEFCDYLEIDGCSFDGNTISFDQGSRLRQLSAMANLWIDIPIGKAVTPYLGGGLGVTGFEIEGEGTGKFAWQLGAGVAAHLSPSIAVTLDYRHRQVSGKKFPWDGVAGFEVGKIKTNSFSAGLRFTF